MASRNLLVPGTGGCKLLLNGDDIGWPGELTAAGWMAKVPRLAGGFETLGAKYAKPEEIVSVLSMEHDDDPQVVAPRKTTLWPGGTIVPGSVLALAYNQLLNPPRNFDTFLYDWRGDLRHSADQLLGRLESEPAQTPRRLVAHSQGGLVVAAAARRWAERHGDDDRAFSKLVSHVALLGTPLHGTINSADAFITGDELAAPFSDQFKKIARTWPALYQMLPIWAGSVKLVTGTLVQDAPFNAMDERTWPGQDVSPAQLARARLVRSRYVRPGLAFMNGVKLRLLQSRAYPTRDRLLVQGNQTRSDGAVAGDTLVPDDLTRDTGTQFQRDATYSIGRDGNTMVHFALATDPAFATEVSTFFNQ